MLCRILVYYRTQLEAVSVVLIFLCFLNTCAASNSDPTQFTDDVSVNCGSSGTFTARNGRKWFGDVHPKISSLLRVKGTSTASSAIGRLLSTDDQVPHRTARLSRYQFSYSFRVSPGQKIICLHFNPAVYKGFKGLNDLFTVEAGSFILLTNFSASLIADDLGLSSFVKEYCLNIEENQELNLVFSPVNRKSSDTYAFINGIEIISVPLSLSYFGGVGNIGVQQIGNFPVYVDSGTALEMIHRQSVKQDPLSLGAETRDMFELWGSVLKTNANKMQNITLKVPVDVGFRYLVRLHFSNLIFKMITEIGGLIYEIQINGMIVNADIDAKTKVGDENSTPLYRDFMVIMKGCKQGGKDDLLICLNSNVEVMDGLEPFQGFEVMKLSNLENSLASPNPLPVVQSVRDHVLDSKNRIVSVATTLLVLINIIVYMLKKKREGSPEEVENMPSAMPQQCCRYFSFAEIQLATRNFSDTHVIGRGGFGKVYKGLIDNGRETVAIKRLGLKSKQGAREFWTEIETLSELRHVNLVSLIGYCNEKSEMILVYQYLANGTLADHLYKLSTINKDCISLTWKQRLSICIGVGQGLDYLHTGSVIHRDVKSSNILLDETLVAKITDFGLAKSLHGKELDSHVSTKVKGTFGYLDPDYFSTGRLTKKSDAYALGVVLLEVLCGRPVIDLHAEENEHHLAAWARENIRKGRADQIVASTLRREISKDSLETYVRVVERCLKAQPRERPTMVEVVEQLEFALGQQKRSELFLPIVSNQVNYIHPADGEANLSVQVMEPNEQTNEPQSERKEGSKSKTHKLSRFRPWGAFWNRVKTTSKPAGLPIAVPTIAADELKDITGNFSTKCLIGKGSCGEVYHGILKSGQAAAIKNFDSSNHPEQEFLAQVSVASSLKHENLVELLGYCVDGRLKVLAYEFASHGSLHDILHGIKGTGQAPVLSWAQRAKISIEAAKGLNHIHQKAHTHLAIKSSNVLLFEDNDVAKIADFGLSNRAADLTQRLTSTLFFGTVGYHAPEYLMVVKQSWRNDVYSFGVVLLELLTGRKPFDHTRPREQEFLVAWATAKISEGKVEEIVDARLKGDYPPNAVQKMAEIAALCVQNEANSRPKMSVVVKHLQSLLDDGSLSGTRNL
ncbi:hypothetical protein C2S52_021372 [Perilla frutescens var. hirtella]|nr:hypothetical protein C2S52_021372 [Perilla frutescens var. hirtella]